MFSFDFRTINFRTIIILNGSACVSRSPSRIVIRLCSVSVIQKKSSTVHNFIHWLKKGKSKNHQIKSTQASLQAKHKPSTITLKFFTSSIIKDKAKNNLTSFKLKRTNRISASNKKSKFKKFKKIKIQKIQIQGKV